MLISSSRLLRCSFSRVGEREKSFLLLSWKKLPPRKSSSRFLSLLFACLERGLSVSEENYTRLKTAIKRGRSASTLRIIFFHRLEALSQPGVEAAISQRRRYRASPSLLHREKPGPESLVCPSSSQTERKRFLGMMAAPLIDCPIRRLFTTLNRPLGPF